VKTAFEITLNYHSGLAPTNATATPSLRNVLFDGISATDSGTLFDIDGLPESLISNLTFRNIDGVGSKTVVAKCDYASGACEGGVLPKCPPCL
jgi:hypothetical protein